MSSQLRYPTWAGGPLADEEVPFVSRPLPIRRDVVIRVRSCGLHDNSFLGAGNRKRSARSFPCLPDITTPFCCVRWGNGVSIQLNGYVDRNVPWTVLSLIDRPSWQKERQSARYRDKYRETERQREKKLTTVQTQALPGVDQRKRVCRSRLPFNSPSLMLVIISEDCDLNRLRAILLSTTGETSQMLVYITFIYTCRRSSSAIVSASCLSLN